MLITILATIQLITTWAGSLNNYDNAVNDEIKKLEQSHQSVEIGDIKVLGKGLYYYGFIPYEVQESPRKVLRIVRQTSTWAGTQSKLDAAVNKEINKLKNSIDFSRQTLTVREINIQMTPSNYYAFIRYEISDSPQKSKSVAKLTSTWASTQSGFDSAVNAKLKKLKNSADAKGLELKIHNLDIQMTGANYYAFITYEIYKPSKDLKISSHQTSTWASTLDNLDSAVNSEVRKLKDSIDPARQTLEIKNICVRMGSSNYYAFISYDIKEAPESVRSTVKLTSTWASKQKTLDKAVNEKIAQLKSMIDPTRQSLIIKNIDVDVRTNYYAFISYEIVDSPQEPEEILYLDSSWAGGNKNLTTELNKNISSIEHSNRKSLSIHNMNLRMTKYYMYYYMTYKLT